LLGTSLAICVGLKSLRISTSETDVWNSSTVNFNLTPVQSPLGSRIGHHDQHLGEITSADNPVEYDWGLTVIQSQFVQGVQSLLLDVFLTLSLH
jgi:hypothetical protein